MLQYRPDLRHMDKDTILFVRKNRVALAYNFDYYEGARLTIMKDMILYPPIDIYYKAGDGHDSWVVYRRAMEAAKWKGITKTKAACAYAYANGLAKVSDFGLKHIPVANYIDADGWSYNIPLDDGYVGFVTKKRYSAGDSTKDIVLSQYSIANPHLDFEQRHLMDDLKLTYKEGISPLDSLTTFNCLFTPVVLNSAEPQEAVIKNALRMTSYNQNDFFANKWEIPLLAHMEYEPVYSPVDSVTNPKSVLKQNYYFMSRNDKLYKLMKTGQIAIADRSMNPLTWVNCAKIFYASASHIPALMTKIPGLEEKIRQAEFSISALESAIEELEGRIQVNLGIIASVTQTNINLAADTVIRQNAIATLTDEITGLNADIEAAEADIESLENDTAAKEQEIADTTDLKTTAIANLAAKNTEIIELENKIGRDLTERRECVLERDAAQTDLISQTASRDSVNTQKESVEADKAALVETLEGYTDSKTAKETEKAGHVAILDDAVAAKKALTDANDTDNATIDGLTAELNNLQPDDDWVDNKREELQTEIDRLDTELGKLEPGAIADRVQELNGLIQGLNAEIAGHNTELTFLNDPYAVRDKIDDLFAERAPLTTELNNLQDSEWLDNKREELQTELDRLDAELGKLEPVAVADRIQELNGIIQNLTAEITNHNAELTLINDPAAIQEKVDELTSDRTMYETELNNLQDSDWLDNKREGLQTEIDRLNAELGKLEPGAIADRVQELNGIIQDLTDERDTLDPETDTDRISEIDDEIAGHNTELSFLNDSDAVQEKIDELTAERGPYQTELDMFEPDAVSARIDSINIEIDRIDTDIAHLGDAGWIADRVQELNGLIQDLNDEIATHNPELDFLNDSDAVQEKINELTAERGPYQTEFDRFEPDAVAARIADINTEIDRINTELGKLGSTAIANRIQELNGLIQGLNAEIAGHNTELDFLNDSDAVQEKIDELTAERNTWQTDLDELHGNEWITEKREELQAEINRIDTELTHLGDSGWIADRIQELNTAIQDLNAEFSTLDPVADIDRINEINALIASHNAELGYLGSPAAIQAKIASLTEERVERVAGLGDLEPDAVAARIDSINTEIEALNTAISGREQPIADQQAIIDSKQTVINSLTNQISVIQGDIDTCQSSIDGKTAEINALIQDITDLETQMAASQAAIDDRNQAIDELTDTINADNITLTGLNTDVTNLETDITNYTEQIATLNTGIADNDAAIEAKEVEITGFEAGIATRTNTITAHNTAITNNTNTIASNEELIATLTNNNTGFSNEIATDNGLIDGLTDQKNRDQARIDEILANNDERTNDEILNDAPPLEPVVLPIPGNAGGTLIAFDVGCCSNTDLHDSAYYRYSVSTDNGLSWNTYPYEIITEWCDEIIPVPYLYLGRLVVKAKIVERDEYNDIISESTKYFSTQNGTSWVELTKRTTLGPYVMIMEPSELGLTHADNPGEIADTVYRKFFGLSDNMWGDIYVSTGHIDETDTNTDKYVFTRTLNNLEVFEKYDDLISSVMRSIVDRLSGVDGTWDALPQVDKDRCIAETQFKHSWDSKSKWVYTLYSFHSLIGSEYMKESGEVAVSSEYSTETGPGQHLVTVRSLNYSSNNYEDMLRVKLGETPADPPGITDEEILVRENFAGAHFIEFDPGQTYRFNTRWVIRDVTGLERRTGNHPIIKPHFTNNNGSIVNRVSMNGKEWFPIRGTGQIDYEQHGAAGQFLFDYAGKNVFFMETGEYLTWYPIPHKIRFHYDLRVKSYKWEGIKLTQPLRATYIVDTKNAHQQSTEAAPIKIGFPVKINPKAFILFYNGLPVLGDTVYVNPDNEKELVVEFFERQKVLQKHIQPVQFILNKRNWVYNDFQVVIFSSEDERYECVMCLDRGRVRHSGRELFVDFASTIVGDCILLNGIDHEYLITGDSTIKYPISRYGLHEALYAGSELNYIGLYNIRTDVRKDVYKIQFSLVEK